MSVGRFAWHITLALSFASVALADESPLLLDAEGDSADAWGDAEADSLGFGATTRSSEANHQEGRGASLAKKSNDAAFANASSDDRLDDDGSSTPGALSAMGYIRHRTALWTEQLSTNALAQAKTSLDGQVRYHKRLFMMAAPWTLRLVAGGHGEVDAVYFYDQQRFDEATIDLYKSRLIGGETYASLAQGPFEITIGRQIVPFGQGNMLSTLDVVNPRDLREPGLMDLEDMRIAVLASRAGIYAGYHRFELMMVHEAYFGLRPPPMSFFSPVKPLLAALPLPALIPHEYSDRPKRYSVDGQQYYVRYGYAGPGLDLALYGVSTLDQQGLPALSTIAEMLAIAATGETPKLQLMHRRYLMAGVSAAVPVGDLVIRGEAGLDVDRPIGLVEPTGSVAPDEPLFNYAFREQLNWMAGVTYAGISNANLSLEYAGRHVFHQPARLLRPSLADLGLLYRHSLFDERVRLTLAAGTFGLFYHYQGLFGRLEIDYMFDSGVHAGVGYATYQPHGDDRLAALSGFGRNDRAYVTLRWDFMLD